MAADGRGGEIISVVQRRRRWTVDRKLALVEEVSRPGASVAAVAGRHGMSPSLLFDWRRQLREGTMPGVVGTAPGAPTLVPVRVVEHAPASGCACPACGGALRKVGEDVSEVLQYRPGRFEVVRHVRPAFSCRACERMTQAPMPSLPVERGRPGPGLLAHIAVSKFCDHLPLYRQAEIYARDGVELPRGLMAT